MSAALQLNPSQNQHKVLAMLTDLVRQGVDGAFEALCQQLKPLLITLAVELKPEDPHDLLTALFRAVLRGKQIVTYLEKDIRTVYRNLWRGDKREKRKVAHLTLVHGKDHQEAFTPGEVSILLKYLTDEERLLWIGVSEGRSIPQLAEELGWSVRTTEARWAELQARLRETLASEKE